MVPPFLHFPGPPPLENSRGEERNAHPRGGEGQATARPEAGDREEVIGSDCLYGEQENNMINTSKNNLREDIDSNYIDMFNVYVTDIIFIIINIQQKYPF